MARLRREGRELHCLLRAVVARLLRGGLPQPVALLGALQQHVAKPPLFLQLGHLHNSNARAT